MTTYHLHYKLIALREIFTPFDRSLSPAEITNAIIETLLTNPKFIELSRIETGRTVQRDQMDAGRLHLGVKRSIDEGKLKPLRTTINTKKISVDGLTTQEIIGEIKKGLKTSSSGRLITISGKSGTGKGTTSEALTASFFNGVAYSNGDVFRVLTYLTIEALGANIPKLRKEKGKYFSQLPTHFFEKLLKGIKFEFSEGKPDIVIKSGRIWGKRVSEIKNSRLKARDISILVPLVAARTQGLSIAFARKAIKEMIAKGYTVIQEGRQVSLDHLPTSDRFELVLNDAKIIGQRRIAQRIAAKIENICRTQKYSKVYPPSINDLYQEAINALWSEEGKKAEPN